MSCGKARPPQLFFAGVLPNFARLHEPSSSASLDPRRCGRTIHAALNLPNTLSHLDREHRCPSLRRIHRRTPVPDRGRRCRDRSLARAHCPDSRGPDRADAFLWTDPWRGRQPAAPVADSRSRTRLQRGPSSVASDRWRGAILFARRPGLRTAALACVASLGVGGSRNDTNNHCRRTPARTRGGPDPEPAAISSGWRTTRPKTDRTWRPASWGFVALEKISDRSSLGDFEIPDASAWLRLDLTLSAVT
jgi:hypothetical protein